MDKWTDEQISSFCAVTGADDQTANHFLSAADGNVEIAVSLFLDNPTGAAGPSSIAKTTEPEVRAPIQPKRAVLVEDDYSSENYPINPPLAFPPMEPFRDFRSEHIPYLGDTATDPRGVRLASLFRPPTEIIFPGTFESARKHARSESRWLIVTVHDPSEFACQQMVRDVWNDAAIQDFIKEELIFVFVTVGTGEAERYQQYYPFSGFPHWSLVDPRTGKRAKSGGRVIKAPEMLMELVDYVSEHPLQTKRPSPTTLEELKMTAEPEVEKVGEVKPAVLEPVPEEPPEGEDTLTVQIRLPDGKRQRRRFRQSDKIKTIFEFVRASCPDLAEFDIQSHRKSFGEFQEEAIENHELKNASLTVVIKGDQ